MVFNLSVIYHDSYTNDEQKHNLPLNFSKTRNPLQFSLLYKNIKL